MKAVLLKRIKEAIDSKYAQNKSVSLLSNSILNSPTSVLREEDILKELEMTKAQLKTWMKDYLKNSGTVKKLIEAIYDRGFGDIPYSTANKFYSPEITHIFEDIMNDFGVKYVKDHLKDTRDKVAVSTRKNGDYVIVSSKNAISGYIEYASNIVKDLFFYLEQRTGGSLKNVIISKTFKFEGKHSIVYHFRVKTDTFDTNLVLEKIGLGLRNVSNASYYKTRYDNIKVSPHLESGLLETGEFYVRFIF